MLLAGHSITPPSAASQLKGFAWPLRPPGAAARRRPRTNPPFRQLQTRAGETTQRRGHWGSLTPRPQLASDPVPSRPSRDRSQKLNYFIKTTPAPTAAMWGVPGRGPPMALIERNGSRFVKLSCSSGCWYKAGNPSKQPAGVI